ncbi:MAG: Pilus assembly protein [Oscillospiraceae bacterium]
MELSARRLSANQIKWIAIVAMLIDHTAWAFVPTYSVLGQLMHVVGRITAPIMCFFIAEGYAYTHNFKRYAYRLALFALISQIPFTLFLTGQLRFVASGLFSESFNVIYTLFLSLMAIRVYDKIENPALRTLAVIGLCILSLPGDWMVFDILFTLVFWQYRGSFRRQAQAFSIVAVYMMFLMVFIGSFAAGRPIYSQLFQAGVFLSLPILSLYSGERGGGRYSKWAFYIFYPAHLLVLGILKLCI